MVTQVLPQAHFVPQSIFLLVNYLKEGLVHREEAGVGRQGLAPAAIKPFTAVVSEG
jgi:hypothetical protein